MNYYLDTAMTNETEVTPEPTEAQIKEACDLLDGAQPFAMPVARLIAQRDTERAEHEAFRQQVSEMAKNARSFVRLFTDEPAKVCIEEIEKFIIPTLAPTPEQVFEAACREVGIGLYVQQELTAALGERGHHVAPIKGEG